MTTTTPSVPTTTAVLTAFKRPSGSDPGVKTVLIGIAVLWIILTILNPRFLTPDNLVNLLLQIAAVATIAMGAVMVLLLGEIDLSLGSVSGFTAAIMATLNVNAGMPALAAIAVAVLAGAVVGALQGLIFTRLGVPSFVVTLGGLLAWQGAHLSVLGQSGNINITDSTIIGITGTYLPTPVSLVLAAVLCVAVFVGAVRRRQRRIAGGLQHTSFAASMVQPALIAVAVIGALAVLLSSRGVPTVVLVVLVICAVLDLFLRRTRTGRHVYAVGSNAEAARRVGINVTGIRVLAFTLSASLAAFGGVLAASRLFAVNSSSGGSDLLLLAIASAVIGGVSLFGGVGSVWYALLGAVLVGSIANGMNLLSIPASIRFIVTGAVLVIAVAIDALARKRAVLKG